MKTSYSVQKQHIKSLCSTSLDPHLVVVVAFIDRTMKVDRNGLKVRIKTLHIQLIQFKGVGRGPGSKGLAPG